MRVLVTGATGYIGRHTLPLLVRAGHDVHAASRNGFASAAQPAAATWHAVDLLQEQASERLIDEVRPEAVLHFAWNATPGVYWTAPDNVDWTRATVALFSAFARSGGRRFVGAGTCAEYDWSAGGVCRERSTPTLPQSLYGQSKLSAWQQIERLASEETTAAAWGRIFYLFGSEEHPKRLAPSIARALWRGESVGCSSGEQRRDFLHVTDVAGAFAALLDSPACGAVNIGSGTGRPVRDVIDGIASRIGRPDLIRLGERPTEAPPELTADVGRLFGEVGWRPAMSFDQALDEVVEHWRRSGTLSA